MSVLHLGDRDAHGVIRPACGADPHEPAITPEELRQQARKGAAVCDRCVAIATAREESEMNPRA